MLSKRSYRIGSEQGIVDLRAAVFDRQYHWVVSLEPSIDVGVVDPPVVLRRTEVRSLVMLAHQR